MAIVYLPTDEPTPLSLHDAFLPVIVPSSSTTKGNSSVRRQAAEDDWDRLGVPVIRTVQANGGKSPVIDGETISDMEPLHAYKLLSNIGNKAKKCNHHKPLTEKIKSVNTVTLYGIPSLPLL